MKEKIVTFSCQKNVFVYPIKCSLLPRMPFKIHDTIYDAKEYLIKNGRQENDIEIIIEK